MLRIVILPYTCRNPAVYPFQCTRGCEKRFRAASTRDKHMYSSCPVKFKCDKCGAQFDTMRKHSTHIKKCSGTAPLLPPGSLPIASGDRPSAAPMISSRPPLLATVSSPSTSTCSVPKPSTPSASGDQPLIGPGLDIDQENSLTVTVDTSFNLPSFAMPTVKTFDLDSYLTGDVDFDIFNED